jgi:hypothetical protein
MSLRAAASVRPPPANIIDRFRGTMIAVARTWAAVGRVADVQITSWWRSPEKNANTPHATTYSQHLLGCAMDATSSTHTQGQLLELAKRAAAQFGTQAIVSERGAVHVQGLPYGYVKAVLTREPTLVSGSVGFIGPAQRVL